MATRATALDPLAWEFRKLPKPPAPNEKNRNVELPLPNYFFKISPCIYSIYSIYIYIYIHTNLQVSDIVRLPHIYIYIYICMYVCMYVCIKKPFKDVREKQHKYQIVCTNYYYYK